MHWVPEEDEAIIEAIVKSIEEEAAIIEANASVPLSCLELFEQLQPSSFPTSLVNDTSAAIINVFNNETILIPSTSSNFQTFAGEQNIIPASTSAIVNFQHQGNSVTDELPPRGIVRPWETYSPLYQSPSNTEREAIQKTFNEAFEAATKTTDETNLIDDPEKIPISCILKPPSSKPGDNQSKPTKRKYRKGRINGKFKKGFMRHRDDKELQKIQEIKETIKEQFGINAVQLHIQHKPGDKYFCY